MRTGQFEPTIEAEDFDAHRDLPLVDDLARMMAVLARVVGARSVTLTAHPMGGAAGVLAAVPAGAPPEDVDRALRLGQRLLLRPGLQRPEWNRGGTDEEACLIVPLDEVAGHSRLVVTFHFEAITAERRARADAYVDRQPFADGYFDLWQLSRLRQRRCAALEEALNRADDGVILVSRSTHILFANEAAEAIIAAGKGLRRAQGMIRATSLADSVNLQMTLEHVVAASAESGEGTARGSGHVLALRRRSEPPLLLLVLPSGTPPVEPTDVAAVIYLADPRLDPGRMLLPVCHVYGLSPVETELVGHLAAGRTLATAAAGMRVKEQTARGYLKNIFTKTSTNRQTEVVALMLGSLVHVKQSVLKNVGFRGERRAPRLFI